MCKIKYFICDPVSVTKNCDQKIKYFCDEVNKYLVMKTVKNNYQAQKFTYSF